MTEQVARNVGPDHIDIACESFGDPLSPPVLLIMGLGSQMLGWNEGFCAELVARGLRAIRFDNRDCGRSTLFSDRPPPDLRAGAAGDFSTAAYGLADMAADAVGLLDVLGIARAHVVGASMGGQIAQIIATEYPARVLSLTSMMSWTGARSGQMAPEVLQLFALPPPATREQAMQNRVATFRAIGSPGFPFDEAEVRERAGLAFDRQGYDAGAMPRQGHGRGRFRRPDGAAWNRARADAGDPRFGRPHGGCQRRPGPRRPPFPARGWRSSRAWGTTFPANCGRAWRR